MARLPLRISPGPVKPNSYAGKNHSRTLSSFPDHMCQATLIFADFQPAKMRSRLRVRCPISQRTGSHRGLPLRRSSGSYLVKGRITALHSLTVGQVLSTPLRMDFARAQATLRAAELCLAHGLSDSAANRAYFAGFQAAIWALENQGVSHREWSHRGVHSAFVQRFVRRRKVVPASFASALPNLMRQRHIGDYEQTGVSQRAAERTVRLAREFVALLAQESRHA